MAEVQNFIRIFLFLVLLFETQSSISNVPPSHILFVPIPYRSHLNVLISITRALSHCHRISFAVFNEDIPIVINKLQRYRSVGIVSLGPLPNVERMHELHDNESSFHLSSRALMSNVADYRPMHDSLLSDLNVHKYDMMIIDIYAHAALDLARDLNIRFMISALPFSVNELNRPSWIPSGYDTLTGKHLRNSFIYRFYNFFILPLFRVYHFATPVRILNEHRRASNRTLLSSSSSLFDTWNSWENIPVLVASSFALELHSHLPIDYHYIGFVLDNQTEAETDKSSDVNAWLDRSKSLDEFVVVVALGTVIIPHERIWKVLIQTLDLIPQMRLLLTVPQQDKHHKILQFLSSGIDIEFRLKIVSWINQQQVLSHSFVRIFITHGGISSLAESIYMHVPLIVLPAFADQFDNAMKVEEANIGYVVDWHTITSDLLASYINKLNDKHDSVVERLVCIHQISELAGGAQKAAKIIDQWLLIGYLHLNNFNSEQSQLSTFVKYNFDSYLLLISIFIIVIYLFLRVSKLFKYRLKSYSKHNKEQ
ncbi:unnamed protein product [Adineta ricciae]|uniref:Uncharacterized protein n=1 Tax=Adineta ricciae TaxID=249248 RepID=A0A814AMK3_ADIRI|nr:unnamed protein product [Adineta ricciae]CAF1415393.1 unnamed protein product [Adineta ricciae]